MISNKQNLSAWHYTINDIHIKRFERFLKKNKLDNALVIDESGEVIDLYSESILHMDIGLMPSVWMQFCRQMSKGFCCIGNIFFRASDLSRIWTLFCYRLSGGFHYIGSLLFRAGNIGS